MEGFESHFPVLLAPGCVVFGDDCDVPPAFRLPGTVARSAFDDPVVVPVVAPPDGFIVSCCVPCSGFILVESCGVGPEVCANAPPMESPSTAAAKITLRIFLSYDVGGCNAAIYAMFLDIKTEQHALPSIGFLNQFGEVQMAQSDHGIVLDEKAQEQPKDKKRAQEPSSNDLKGPAPREDKERDTRQAADKDADENDGKDRDLVHGDGGAIGLPTKPVDIPKDD